MGGHTVDGSEIRLTTNQLRLVVYPIIGKHPMILQSCGFSRRISGCHPTVCRDVGCHSQEEERLVLKGAQERIRAEARERREQLREAQRLQVRGTRKWTKPIGSMGLAYNIPTLG